MFWRLRPSVLGIFVSRVHGPCIVGSAGGAAVGCHTGPRIWAVGTRAWPSVNQFEPAHVSCPGPRTQVPVAAADDAAVHGSTITPAQWYTTPPAPGSCQPPLPLHYPNPGLQLQGPPRTLRAGRNPTPCRPGVRLGCVYCDRFTRKSDESIYFILQVS